MPHRNAGQSLRFLRAGLLVHAASAVPALFSFILLPVLVRRLGIETFGIWTVLVMVTTLLGSADYAVTVEITRASSDDEDPVAFDSAVTFALLFAVVSSVVILAGALIAPTLMVASDGRTDLRLVTSAFTVAYLGERIVGICRAVHFGRSDFHKVASFAVGFAVLRGMLLLISALHGASIELLALLNAGASLISAVGMLLKTPMRLTRRGSRSSRWRDWKRRAADSVAAKIASIAAQAIWYLPFLLAAMLAGPALAGSYYIAFRIPQMILTMNGSVASVLLPKLTSSDDSHDVFIRHLTESMRACLIVALPLGMVVMASAPALLMEWVQISDVRVAQLLRVLTASVLVEALMAAAWQALLSARREWILAWTQVEMLAGACIATVALTQFGFITGAAVALLGTASIGSVVILVRTTHLAPSKILTLCVNASRGLILPSIAAAVVTRLVLNVSVLPSEIVLLLAMAAGGAVFAAGFVFFGIRPDERTLLARVVRERF